MAKLFSDPAKQRAYHSWCGARRRCHSPKDRNYAVYGAKGITVCEEWRDNFEAFFAYMGPRPEGLSLDRIDNKGNYEPGNVRWADAHTQRVNQNKRGISNDLAQKELIAKLYENGATMKDLAIKFNIGQSTISRILKEMNGASQDRVKFNKPEIVEKILEKRAGGESMNSIAKSLNVSTTVVQNCLRRRF